MAAIDFNKRLVIQLGLMASAGIFIGAPAFAQKRKLFGITLPKEISDILPQDALSIAETADAVISLEREADQIKLPQSLLSWDTSEAVTANDSSFYTVLLPRLVALIDRSEFRNTDFADKAGGLLAQLHATQHEVPEAWRGLGVSAAASGTRGFLNSLDPVVTDAPVSAPALPPVLSDVLAVPAQNGPAPAPEASPLPSEVPPSEVPPIPQSSDIDPPAASDAPANSPPENSKPDDKPAAAEENRPLSRRRDFASLSSEYRRLYSSIAIRPERSKTANWHLSMLRNAKPRYETVANLTGVPWYFIGITHGLEASFNFRAHLHNGDFPLTSRTRQVPSGRPKVWLPPADWNSSARDALALLGFTGQRDWSLERTLYRLEAYNGLGYRSFGVASPYLWSFSNHYDRGKFVSDGKWSNTARSQQCGAAVMLKLLEEAGDINLA
jgi:lysozyme family protein